MGILSRLFGDVGKVRFEGVTAGGRAFSGKISIEAFNYSRKELEENLKVMFYVETGEVARELHITAFVEQK